MDSDRAYISYLLRLWQLDSSGKRVWLASLESPQTGEIRGFSNLVSLFDFLRAQTEDDAQHCTGHLSDLKGVKDEPPEISS